ncbi:ArnT family glycosyltransferase [Halomicroarcula sp. GCM10025324]|uniref:ArnT family glycosyltransferase n=1 Tax=Haloarcula TaxID=2237 RepID=UPI0023E84EFC|nr:glycosyltransferase family 39 protein [Halomicroarcula sp. ZS-22-S1]
MSSLRRPSVQAAVVAVLGGLVVFALSTVVFPYHTTNHDEAVYLQQAAMLLDGQLFLRPPVAETFRPWFFVEDGGRLYPKYTPVAAAVFAVGQLLGGFRIALALVATGTLALTYLTVREAFDERTGVVASVLMLGSPLFLVDASVFLSYVPTMLFNIGFAAAYLHADRTGHNGTASLAGACIGLAFFSRPYTAVLFATPFVLHALWSLRGFERPVLVRVGLTALFGLAGVGLTLAYNSVVTGEALVFPYQAFAPNDGLGFGRRSILGYSREFTPALSLEANVELLSKYATRWVVAGPLGTLVALVGVWTATRRGLDSRQSALAGVFLTVTLGNLYFWGTVNMLGDLADPTDGLVRFLGPYYHVDLLVPTVAFGAVGVIAVGRAVTSTVEERVAPARVRPALVAVTLVLATLGGTAAVAAAADPVGDNLEVTRQYEQAYEPFEDDGYNDAVVFLPTPYGDWLNHPFQALRNDPGFDDGTVYAMQHRQFAVVDAYPDRAYYRYVYRGQWAPFLGQSVEPRVQRVNVVEGSAVGADVTATIPAQAELVSLRLTDDRENAYATARGVETLNVTLRVGEEQTRMSGPGLDETATVPTPERGPVALSAFVDYGTGAGFTYRVVVPVERTEAGVRALTPRLEMCRDQRRCDGEAAYVPGAHRDGIELNATLSEVTTE